LEFGTKKAKKAIASMSENAVNQGIVDADGNISAASKIILDAVSQDIKNMPTLEDMALASQVEKPKPRANMSATKPEEVYPLNQLIPPEQLEPIRTQDWMETAATTGISFPCRYVTRRAAAVVRQKDYTKVKVLKYMLACILFLKALKPGRKGRPLPPRQKLREKMEGVDDDLINAVRGRFCKAS
jgi:DNA-directed RNA polymerase I subunit RPA49